MTSYLLIFAFAHVSRARTGLCGKAWLDVVSFYLRLRTCQQSPDWAMAMARCCSAARAGAAARPDVAREKSSRARTQLYNHGELQYNEPQQQQQQHASADLQALQRTQANILQQNSSGGSSGGGPIRPISSCPVHIIQPCQTLLLL